MSTSRDRENLVRIPHSESFATLEELARRGVKQRHFTLIRSDKDYADAIARAMIYLAIKPHPLDAQLAGILDASRYFGPTDWARHYGVEFAQDFGLPLPLGQLQSILDEPCPFVAGRQVKDTHVLYCLPKQVNGKALTVMEWQAVHPEDGQPKFYSYGEKSWYREYEWAKEHVAGSDWYLTFEGVLPGSQKKKWNEQLEMVPKDYVVPNVVGVLPMHFLFFQKDGRRINESMYGRTSDIDSDGARVGMGDFDDNGLSINSDWDDVRSRHLGVFVARKLKI